MPRTVYSASAASTIGPYSHAVSAGDLVYFSGQTPIDPGTGKLIAGGIAEQTRQCFRNLFAVLHAAGLETDDIVKVNVFLTDMHDFSQMNEVYAREFQSPYPARTTIGVVALPMDARIEIEMIAFRTKN
jgi:2-iminobutanoate/2-iminopropanoate deaminase